MTADKLRQAEARYQRASRRAEAERAARNAAVRAALAAGAAPASAVASYGTGHVNPASYGTG